MQISIKFIEHKKPKNEKKTIATEAIGSKILKLF